MGHQQAPLLSWHEDECGLPRKSRMTDMTLEMERKAFHVFTGLKKKILPNLLSTGPSCAFGYYSLIRKTIKHLLGNKSQHLLSIRA